MMYLWQEPWAHIICLNSPVHNLPIHNLLKVQCISFTLDHYYVLNPIFALTVWTQLLLLGVLYFRHALVISMF